MSSLGFPMSGPSSGPAVVLSAARPAGYEAVELFGCAGLLFRRVPGAAQAARGGAFGWAGVLVPAPESRSKRSPLSGTTMRVNRSRVQLLVGHPPEEVVRLLEELAAVGVVLSGERRTQWLYGVSMAEGYESALLDRCDRPSSSAVRWWAWQKYWTSTRS